MRGRFGDGINDGDTKAKLRRRAGFPRLHVMAVGPLDMRGERSTYPLDPLDQSNLLAQASSADVRSTYCIYSRSASPTYLTKGSLFDGGGAHRHEPVQERPGLASATGGRRSETLPWLLPWPFQWRRAASAHGHWAGHEAKEETSRGQQAIAHSTSSAPEAFGKCTGRLPCPS